jgi:hypothetical protein
MFGKGASTELYSPANISFPYKAINKALEDGIVAIVPDIDLEPRDQDLLTLASPYPYSYGICTLGRNSEYGYYKPN